MKELSTEEKAKRYDEALDEAKAIHKAIRQELKPVIKQIFPELEEPEDERIRKQIISFLKEFECDHYRSIDFSSWIVWLEKQGEQKPINKVEPKFKVGDFIVNDYCRGKVVELTNDAYLLDTGQGMPFSYEHNIHLWSIEDAKDGDVLVASDNSIFIFARVYGHACIHHIALDSDGTLKINPRLISAWESVKGVKPATEEQRDKLKKAMLKAGYKWNADKKELIKL